MQHDPVHPGITLKEMFFDEINMDITTAANYLDFIQAVSSKNIAGR